MALLIARVALITNPASRLGARRVAAAADAFRALGVECVVLHTTHAGHEAELALDAAPRVDAVFVLGGDGTVMNVASALAGSGVPIGILPAGTGNLLATELGIPRSTRRAVRALARGSVRRLDLGRVEGGRHFAFASGMGIDAAMILGTSRTAKSRWGMLGYAVVAARAALRHAAFDVTVRVDGRVAYRGPATLAMVVNGGSLLGGLLRFGPGVAPDDGMLDVCIYRTQTLRDALAIVWRLLRRDYRPDPRMHFTAGRQIELTADPAQLFESDGELVSQSPVRISVQPGASSFLVPAGSRHSSVEGGKSTPRRIGVGVPETAGGTYDSATAHRFSARRGGSA